MNVLGILDLGVGDFAALLAGAAALVAMANPAHRLYKRTIGRRRGHYSSLARLAVGVQLAVFESALGRPPTIRRTVVKEDFRELVDSSSQESDELREVFSKKDFIECLFIERDHCVQAICDEERTVLAFSVTTRHPRFRPVFQMPPNLSRRERWHWRRRTGEPFKPIFRVRLGKTKFAELDRGDPDEFTGPHFRAWIGARSCSYSEDHYFGFPGYYQTFVFTTGSNAGAAFRGIGALGEAIREADGEEWPDRNRHDQPEWKQMPMAQAFRQQAVVTTYTLLSPRIWLENYPSTFGPHGDEVQILSR